MEENIDLNKYKPNRPEPKPWPTWRYVILIIYLIILSYRHYNEISDFLGIILVFGIFVLTVIDEYLLKLYKYPRFQYYIDPLLSLYLIYSICKQVWFS